MATLPDPRYDDSAGALLGSTPGSPAEPLPPTGPPAGSEASIKQWSWQPGEPPPSPVPYSPSGAEPVPEPAMAPPPAPVQVARSLADQATTDAFTGSGPGPATTAVPPPPDLWKAVAREQLRQDIALSAALDERIPDGELDRLISVTVYPMPAAGTAGRTLTPRPLVVKGWKYRTETDEQARERLARLWTRGQSLTNAYLMARLAEDATLGLPNLSDSYVRWKGKVEAVDSGAAEVGFGLSFASNFLPFHPANLAFFRMERAISLGLTAGAKGSLATGIKATWGEAALAGLSRKTEREVTGLVAGLGGYFDDAGRVVVQQGAHPEKMATLRAALTKAAEELRTGNPEAKLQLTFELTPGRPFDPATRVLAGGGAGATIGAGFSIPNLVRSMANDSPAEQQAALEGVKMGAVIGGALGGGIMAGVEGASAGLRALAPKVPPFILREGFPAGPSVAEALDGVLGVQASPIPALAPPPPILGAKHPAPAVPNPSASQLSVVLTPPPLPTRGAATTVRNNRTAAELVGEIQTQVRATADGQTAATVNALTVDQIRWLDDLAEDPQPSAAAAESMDARNSAMLYRLSLLRDLAGADLTPLEQALSIPNLRLLLHTPRLDPAGDMIWMKPVRDAIDRGDVPVAQPPAPTNLDAITFDDLASPNPARRALALSRSAENQTVPVGMLVAMEPGPSDPPAVHIFHHDGALVAPVEGNRLVDVTDSLAELGLSEAANYDYVPFVHSPLGIRLEDGRLLLDPMDTATRDIARANLRRLARPLAGPEDSAIQALGDIDQMMRAGTMSEGASQAMDARLERLAARARAHGAGAEKVAAALTPEGAPASVTESIKADVVRQANDEAVLVSEAQRLKDRYDAYLRYRRLGEWELLDHMLPENRERVMDGEEPLPRVGAEKDYAAQEWLRRQRGGDGPEAPAEAASPEPLPVDEAKVAGDGGTGEGVGGGSAESGSAEAVGEDGKGVDKRRPMGRPPGRVLRGRPTPRLEWQLFDPADDSLLMAPLDAESALNIKREADGTFTLSTSLSERTESFPTLAAAKAAAEQSEWSASLAPAGEAPWQIPRERFVREWGEGHAAARRAALDSGAEVRLGEGMGPEELHRRSVADALRRGEPVPPEVLADYPDLAPEGGPPRRAFPRNPKRAPRTPDSLRRAAEQRLGQSGIRSDEFAALDEGPPTQPLTRASHVLQRLDALRSEHDGHPRAGLRHLKHLTPRFDSAGRATSPSWAKGWTPDATTRESLLRSAAAVEDHFRKQLSSTEKIAIASRRHREPGEIVPTQAPAPLSLDELHGLTQIGDTAVFSADEFATFMDESGFFPAERRFYSSFERLLGIATPEDKERLYAISRRLEQIEDEFAGRKREEWMAAQDTFGAGDSVLGAAMRPVHSTARTLWVFETLFRGGGVLHFRPEKVIGLGRAVQTPGDLARLMEAGAVDANIWAVLRGGMGKEGALDAFEFIKRSFIEMQPIFDVMEKDIGLRQKLWFALNAGRPASALSGQTIPANPGVAQMLSRAGHLTADPAGPIPLSDLSSFFRAKYSEWIDAASKAKVRVAEFKSSEALGIMNWWRQRIGELAERALPDATPEQAPTINRLLTLLDAPNEKFAEAVTADIGIRDLDNAIRAWRAVGHGFQKQRDLIAAIEGGKFKRQHYATHLHLMLRDDLVAEYDSPYSDVRWISREVMDRFLDQRRLDDDPYPDLLVSLMVYLPVMSRTIYLEPALYKAKPLLDQLPPLEHQYADAWWHQLKGQRHPTDIASSNILLTALESGNAGLTGVVDPTFRKAVKEKPGHFKATAQHGLSKALNLTSSALFLGMVHPGNLFTLTGMEYGWVPVQLAAEGPKAFLTRGLPSWGYGLVRGAYDFGREGVAWARHKAFNTPMSYSDPHIAGALELFHESGERYAHGIAAVTGKVGRLTRRIPGPLREIARAPVEKGVETLFRLQFAFQIALDQHQRASAWWTFRRQASSWGLPDNMAKFYAKMMVDRIYSDYGKMGQSPFTKGGFNPAKWVLKRFFLSKIDELSGDMKTVFGMGGSAEPRPAAAHLRSKMAELAAENDIPLDTLPQSTEDLASLTAHMTPGERLAYQDQIREISRTYWNQRIEGPARKAAAYKLIATGGIMLPLTLAYSKFLGLNPWSAIPWDTSASIPVYDQYVSIKKMVTLRAKELSGAPMTQFEKNELRRLVRDIPTYFVPAGSVVRQYRREQRQLFYDAGLGDLYDARERELWPDWWAAVSSKRPFLPIPKKTQQARLPQ